MSTLDPNAITLDGTEMTAVARFEDLARVGPYTIVRTLGRGGMGLVLLGESALPKRQAAIKLMLAETVESEALGRFRREMEVLARLEHVGIARLYEVGAVKIGDAIRPWYAMEYVHGLTLEQHVQVEKLGPEGILALCAKVARALHYAHQRGVIHRDIKPGNIVVNADGEPKILDFGIAKFSQDDPLSQETRFGQIVGTLAYMSPEQLGASHLVDVRSDVYALGVVMYQLLSGSLPFELKTDSLLDAIKTLTEGRRQRLSERAPRLRGEIELIVDTAAHRDLDQRYDSAASLADDLEAYVNHRPLKARPASALYIFRKFTQRNPLLTAALTLSVVALVAATVFSGLSANRARAAEKIAQVAQADAEARAAEASAVVGFLSDALAGAAPERTHGREVKLIDVLADASRQRLPPAQANIEARIRQTLLETWLALGQYPEARRESERLDALCDALREVPSCDQKNALRARLLSLTGEHEAALPVIKQGLSDVRRAFGANSTEALNAELDYADVLNQLGDSDQSIKVLQEALKLSLSNPQLPPRIDLKLRTYLSDALAEQGDLKGAEAGLQLAIERVRGALGEDFPAVLLARNSLLTFLIDREDFTGAVREYTRLKSDVERVLGREHRITMTVIGNLAVAQLRSGQYAAAEANLRQRTEVFARKYPSDWKSILNNAVTLSAVNAQRNQFEPGLADLDLALGAVPASKSFPAELANALNWRAFFLWKLRRNEESAQAYEALVARFTAEFGEGDVQLTRYRSRWGAVLIDLGQTEKGRALIDTALPQLLESYGPEHIAVRDAHTALAKLK